MPRRDDGDAYLPFFSTYPKLVERTQTREDTTSEPTAIASLGRVARGMNFSLVDDETLCVVEKLPSTHMIEYPVQFAVQPVRKAWEQTSSSAEYHVAQQHLTNVGIT